ncbi:MAG: PAS domain-containing protein [Cypionkella sp.]
MSRNYLASDLPLLFELEPEIGRLQSVLNRQAATASLGDLMTLLHPDDRAKVSAALDEAVTLDLARFRVAARLSRPSGRQIAVMIHGAAVVDATPRRYLCTITDESAHTAVLDRFNLATAASTDVIFMLDFDTNEHWWSEAFTRVFGHEPFASPDAVERWFELVHPSDQLRIRATHSAARAGTAETWKDEYRFRKADGSYARVIDRARFFRRPDGSIARSISTMTDVTDLREVENLFQQTAEAAQDVIYNHDLAAGTLWLNDAFRSRYGYDPQAFAADPHGWVQLLEPVDRPGFVLVCEQAVRGTTRNLELSYRLRTADGQTCTVIDRAQIIRDETGRALRIVGSIVDVTAQREEEERLRAVVEVAANVVYEYDVATDTFFYSEGMERTFGHDWTGPQPAKTIWVDQLHPEERARVEADYLGFLASTERYARLEYRFARADGSWANVYERMIALRDEDGVALRVIGGIEDVTAAHETQERLRQSQKLEAIGRLTGGVAHDFNNLLTVIIGGAGLLESDPTLGAEHRAMARNVSSAARRGAELTSGLLSFARQQPLLPRPLDMSATFAELEGMLTRILPAYIVLEAVVPAGLWLTEADPTQLNAALLNLCVNAADAMPEGGRITMESRNWVIDEGYSVTDPEARPGEFVRIDITDSGLGMKADVLSRAFDPFFTTKPVGKGSGLGLSMVWGFAKQSGGHAKIYSEAGIGTTVTMFLPRSLRGALQPVALAPAELSFGKGQHILVVEDDPMLRRFVVALAERLRYRVSQAENGDQALLILQERPDIELLFSDVVMPGHMSGRDLAARALQNFPGLLLLFTSGYSENAIIHNGRLDEGVHFLAKPYQLRDLSEKLREVFVTKALRSGQGEDQPGLRP